MIRALLSASLLGLAACSHAATTYYVDFDHGSDGASGASLAAAFKHAPGDPEAGSRAAAVRLGAGDVVRFAPGVRYRGSIIVKGGGAEGRPLIFESAPGGTAIIDGSDPLPDARPCRSAADCLGAFNWQQLTRVAVPPKALWSDWLFAGDTLLRLAQTPRNADPFTYDNVGDYRTIGRGDLAQLQAGLVPTRERFNPAGSPVLAIWSRPNVIKFGTFTQAPDGLRFAIDKVIPYDDRDNKYAVLNSLDGLNAPGGFVVSGKDGIALVWPVGGSTPLSIGAGRFGFKLDGAAHVVIRGLSFRDFSGQGISTGSTATDDILIAGNSFGPAAMVNGQGAIGMLRPQHFTVRGNDIHDIAFGSGLRAGEAMGPLDVSCNRIARVGRTGIAFLSVAHGRITGNVLSEINGIHGNGITAYLDNRDLVIADNVVTGSMRPVTVHGDAGKPYFDAAIPTAIRVENNVAVGTDPKSAALTSWGKNLRNTVVTGNVFSAPQIAVRFTGDETGVDVHGNHLGGDVRLLHPGGTVRVGSNGGAGGKPAALAAAKVAELSESCRAG